MWISSAGACQARRTGLKGNYPPTPRTGLCDPAQGRRFTADALVAARPATLSNDLLPTCESKLQQWQRCGQPSARGSARPNRGQPCGGSSSRWAQRGCRCADGAPRWPGGAPLQWAAPHPCAAPCPAPAPPQAHPRRPAVQPRAYKGEESSSASPAAAEAQLPPPPEGEVAPAQALSSYDDGGFEAGVQLCWLSERCKCSQGGRVLLLPLAGLLGCAPVALLPTGWGTWCGMCAGGLLAGFAVSAAHAESNQKQVALHCHCRRRDMASLAAAPVPDPFRLSLFAFAALFSLSQA